MSLKRKKRSTAGKKDVPSQPPSPSAVFRGSEGSRTKQTWVLAVLVLALMLVSHGLHYSKAEKIFFIIAMFIGVSFFMRLNQVKHVLVLLALGWVSAALSIGANPNFSFIFSPFPRFNLPDPLAQFGIGMGLLVAFWRFLPPVDPSQDISRGWARAWFLVIFAVAAYFRFYKVHEGCGIYWDDCAVSIIDARSIFEFRERPFLMPIANREPFYCYFLAGLWSLIPHAYAMFVHRLGGGLIDLAALWLFYLCGKEAGGRRVGLIAAALGAVSKPMIIAAFSGNSHVTAPFAAALVLLTTLRLFKNPSWKHFLYWGLSLGFAPYNYTSIRPWLLFIVTGVFLWVWFYAQKGGKTKVESLLGWGTLFAWAFCFLLVNNFLPKQNFLIVFLSRAWVGIVVLLALWLLFFSSFRIPRDPQKPSLTPRFFFAVFLAGLVIYPLATQPLIAVHASGLSIFHSHESLAVHFRADSFKLFLEKIVETFQILFNGGEDRGDMNLSGDAYFDYYFIPLLILGLLSFLAQPNWSKGFLLIAGLVGISPHILSVDPHSGKLACCMAPLAVLAGIGVQQVYSAVKTSIRGMGGRSFALAVLLGYFAWSIWGCNERVINVFFAGCRVEKTVSQQVKKFSLQDKVFIAPHPLFVSFVVQAVMNQGYDAYSLQASNPIFLKPGDKPKNAIVIMHIYDDATKNKIDQQYKNVTWDVVNLDGWKDARPTFRRAIIPSAEIQGQPGQMFYFQRVPETNWTRDYLSGRYILGSGVIDLEESKKNPFDPIAPAMGGRLVNVRGQFTLPAAATLSFKLTTNAYVDFQVDGKHLIYIRPDWTQLLAQKNVRFEAGVHRVEYDIWLQHDQNISPVTVAVDGGPYNPLDIFDRNLSAK